MTFSLADQWRRSIVARLPAKLVGAWLSLTILVPTLFSQGLTAPLGAGVFLGVQGLGLALAFLAHPGLDVYLFLTTRSRLLRLARIELGQPLCAHCEYPMTAMQDAVECPECGRDPWDVQTLRQSLYGFARFVPGLDRVPSGLLRDELRRLWRREGRTVWRRLLWPVGLIAIAASVLVTVNAMFQGTGVLIPPSLKLLAVTMLLAGCFAAVLVIRIGMLVRGLAKFSAEHPSPTPPEPASSHTKEPPRVA